MSLFLLFFFLKASLKVSNIFKGRIIWVTGAPGMGKSTTAQILARNHGFVYYEADCFGSLKVDLCIDFALKQDLL